MNISCPWIPNLGLSRPSENDMLVFLEMVKNNQAILLDVRTQEEWQGERLKGSVNFDFQKIKSGESPDLDTQALILIYCASGSRSEMSKIFLANKGFERLVNIGGISGLITLGFEKVE